MRCTTTIVMKTIFICLTGLLLGFGQPARAALQEEQFELPVQVVDEYGKKIDHTIRVTVFLDDANPKPAPVLVLNHGRPPDQAGRASMGRARYADASGFFVGRGFIVAVPTRIGYGVTGGEDVENSGPCLRKNYPAGFAVAVTQTLAVLDAIRQRPDAAKDRALVVGQSVGGALAVAVAAENPPGVVAAINFAGGNGGDPGIHPRSPCAPGGLEKTFGDYGKTARIPMLWVYTENDLFFGADYPREWFRAFTAEGGKGEFVQFPPHGDDGHSLFTRFPQVWQPKISEFLDSTGFARPAR
jgi:dienelactone hydrolase